MQTKVKICGMTDAASIQTAIDHKVDYLGFVFYQKSPRNLTLEKAKELSKNVPKNVKKIAVLVNAKDEFIEQIKGYFDFFQLHGDEDVKRIKELKKKFNKGIIKTICVTDEVSAKKYVEFENEVDMFIFDSPAMEKTAKFDWKILNKLKIVKPYLIAGSININNLNEILKYRPTGVDVSSGVESKIGVKDKEKIIQFLNLVKS